MKRRSVRDVLSQQHPGAVKLGLGGSGGDAQQLGDLPVLEALDVVEHEHLAGAIGQSLHSGLQLEREVGSRPPAGGPPQHALGVRSDPLTPYAEPLSPRQDQVDRDAVEPGGERGLAPEGVQLLPGADEHVLRDLVREIGSQHASDKGMNAGDVQPVQPLECGQIAAGSESRFVPVVAVGAREVALFSQSDARFHVGFDACSRRMVESRPWIPQRSWWKRESLGTTEVEFGCVSCEPGAGTVSRPASTVWFCTFGCKANQYDTERMRQELEARGAAVVADPALADAAVLNTCTVTARADREALRMIRKLGRRHPGLRIFVAGCSSAVRSDAYAALPEVAGVVPGHDPAAVALQVVPGAVPAAGSAGGLLRSSARGSRGWLKIQDGCDRRCSFCASRIARGGSRSRPLEEVLAEARLLAVHHAELVLTGIHIGHYGLDLEPRTTLSHLCLRLLEAVPAVRFRLGSIEATEIDDVLVRLLETSIGMLAPHLHVPLQSGSDAVLRRMRRWHTSRQVRERLEEIASRVRPLGLGADVIAGFPGETEADHERTRELIETLPYTYLHVFPFSVRERTDALELPGRLPAPVVAERARELRQIGVRKGSAHAASRCGEMALVTVETRDTGLTGDYLRVRLGAASSRPGSLVWTRLAGSVEPCRPEPGTTGRPALPLLEAIPQPGPAHAPSRLGG